MMMVFQASVATFVGILIFKGHWGQRYVWFIPTDSKNTCIISLCYHYDSKEEDTSSFVHLCMNPPPPLHYCDVRKNSLLVQI